MISKYNNKIFWQIKVNKLVFLMRHGSSNQIFQLYWPLQHPFDLENVYIKLKNSKFSTILQSETIPLPQTIYKHYYYTNYTDYNS